MRNSANSLILNKIKLEYQKFWENLMLRFSNKITKHIDTKNGKLPTSHRYNRLPLLRSHPGGFSGAGCVGLAGANIEIIYEFGRLFSKKSKLLGVN